MKSALGLVFALTACTPAPINVVLPGLLDIPVTPSTHLAPDCTYWNAQEHSMGHPPEGAACVTMQTDYTQSAVSAYDSALTRAGWRRIDETPLLRLYEKTVSAGCMRRIDFNLYPAAAPSAESQSSPGAVIIFAPHPGPVCAS